MRKLLLAFTLPVILAAFFVFSLSGYLAYREMENPFAIFDTTFAVFIVGYTAFAYALIFWLGIGAIGKTKLRDLGWFGPSLKKDLALGLAGGLAGALATFFLGWIFQAWTPGQFLEMEMNFDPSQRGLFLVIGLNAGLIEEGLFRGFVQPVLAEKFGLKWALPITALLFALYHLQFRPLGFAGKFILGLIFGTLRGKDKPLVRASIAHTLTWLIIGTA